jgi:hypothetical protein
MSVKLIGLAAGTAFGFVLSWARLTDPLVVRDMLLLREAHVFLIMASAIAIAAAGCRLLRAVSARSPVTGEPVSWAVADPEPRHVLGSVLFGAGWCVAGTCPGPAAAMIGQGRLGGLAVAAGIAGGVVLQQVLARRVAWARSSGAGGGRGLDRSARPHRRAGAVPGGGGDVDPD